MNASTSASADGEIRDHGVPIRASGVFSQHALVDSQGRVHYIQGRGQEPTPFYLLDTCLDTGETVQTNCSVPGALYPWGMCVASNGKVYIGTATQGHFFEYDPETRVLRHLGVPGDETYLWTLDEGTDGRIYGGTYGHAKLVRYNPATGVTEDLGRMDPTEQYVRTVVADDDGYVYGGIGSARAGLIAYEIASGTWRQLIPEEERATGWGFVFRGADGGCYARAPHGVFRLRGGAALAVDDPDSVPAQRGVVLPDGSTITRNEVNTKRFLLTTPTGEERWYTYEDTPAGARLFVLGSGPDGNVYGSSMLPLRLFVYDPRRDALRDLGKPTVPGGEIYSFLTTDDVLWMAAYPGCGIARLDPAAPWKPGADAGDNPRRTPALSKVVYRPIQMCGAPDGRKILICGLPDYGMLGGAISVFDPETMTMEAEYPHVITNQSVTAICVTPAGLVAGGSCVAGGTGSHPTETDARFFLWDYAERRVVFDAVPFEGDARISVLAALPPDRVMGITQRGFLFTFDERSRGLTRVGDLGFGGLVHNPLARTGNGRLLLLFQNHIVEIDPGDLAPRLVAEVPEGINAGVAVADGRVYFCRQDRLLSAPLPAEQAH